MPKPPRTFSKRNYFSTFNDYNSQVGLFEDSKYSRSESLFPVKLYREADMITSFLHSIPDKAYFGLDFEFNSSTKEAFIVGVSYRGIAYGVTFNKTLGNTIHNMIDKRKCRPIAFSAISADKEVLEANIGKTTSIDLWEDAIYTHFLVNSDLTQGKGKEEETDALGLMNLWIASLMAGLEVPNWKECDGMCGGILCPAHDKRGYCALDAWAGEEVFLRNKLKMLQLGIKEDIYRAQLKSEEVFLALSKRGVKVDKEEVYKVNLELERDKDKLFPSWGQGRYQTWETFNPKSPAGIGEYFLKKGIKLFATDIKEIEKQTRKMLKESEYDIDIKELGEKLEEIVDSPLREMCNLYLYKRTGKGTDSWCSDEYVTDNGLIHCRIHNIGTCNGRVSASRPNLTNVPRVGFGVKVRKCFVPRE